MDWVKYHIFCFSILIMFRHAMLPVVYHYALETFKWNRCALKFYSEI